MDLSKTKPRKLKQIAEDLVRTGVKVYRYRIDLMEPKLAEELNDTTKSLAKARKDKSKTREELEKAIEKQDAILRKTGGTFYPNRSWSENVEMFLVGAFLVIGIRTFFFQPFIIPTNSMYPTYNGMTYENYVVAEENAQQGGDLEEVADLTKPPSLPIKILRKLIFGATNVNVVAENAGPVRLRTEPRTVTGRKWFVFPTPKLEFNLDVGGTTHDFRTPVDFQNQIRDILIESIGHNRVVEKGDVILNFDILSGDALFVDRMSYHFRKPDIADPFVFETDLVESDDPQIYSILHKSDPGKYYIKRLVGKGGDTLEIDGSRLIRNGESITGTDAFELNAGRVGNYPGYVHSGYGRFLRRPGDTVDIPEDYYFAMGDNSPNSSDSRTWGFVPKEAVIGRAVLIYYPFTKRWGISK